MKKQSVLNRQWRACILVWIIASINYVLLHEYAVLSNQPEILRRAVKFSVIGLIYWVGFTSLKRLSISWPKQVWMYIYSVSIVLIFASGIYHHLTNQKGTLLSLWVGNISTILQSPVIFLSIIILINRKQDSQ